VFNVEGRYQGAHDSPLTAFGREQAQRVGHLIGRLTQGEADRRLWSSPLGRARHTAEIIRDAAQIAAPMRIDSRLAEVSLGAWDGLTDEEIEAASPGACDGASRFDWFFRSPDGEGYERAEARLASWLKEVESLGGCHIAVSHGLSGRILRGCYVSSPKADALRLEVPQDAVFRLEGRTIEKVENGRG
jgi:probable phosphoglycerate mutase